MERVCPRLGTFEHEGEDLPSSVELDDASSGDPPRERQGTVRFLVDPFPPRVLSRGVWTLSTENLVSLSEQQFVDCDPDRLGL